MNLRNSELESERRFVDLYDRHSPAVMAYALRRCSAGDAPDIVSETFVVAWRRIDEVPEEPGTKPWLLGVARRVLANQRRGLRRRTELVRKASSYLAPHLQDLQNVSAIEQHGERAVILQALRQLPSADQELLMLVAWEELTPAEVAVTLNTSSAIVRKRLFRARKRLAEAAKRIDGEQIGHAGHSQKKAAPDVSALQKQMDAQMRKAMATP